MSEQATGQQQPDQAAAAGLPPFRYHARLAEEIELRWQDYWAAAGTFDSPNPQGPLSAGFRASQPKSYVLDMFAYASGSGIHVGHPEGYIATDVYARYLRMTGHHVLHAMGFDSFGLPAEQFALASGQHPEVTTRAEHRHHAPAAAPPGAGPRLPAQHRHHRSPVLPLDAVDLPADLQQLGGRADWPGAADQRTWWPSTSPGRARSASAPTGATGTGLD